MALIQISKDPSAKLSDAFVYDSRLVDKIKTIPGLRWGPSDWIKNNIGVSFFYFHYRY